jgi:hypothetical protein
MTATTLCELAEQLRGHRPELLRRRLLDGIHDGVALQIAIGFCRGLGATPMTPAQAQRHLFAPREEAR